MNLQTGKETIYKQDFQTSLENANQPEWLKNLRGSVCVFYGKRFSDREKRRLEIHECCADGKRKLLLEMSENVAEELSAENLEIETEFRAKQQSESLFLTNQKKVFWCLETDFSTRICRTWKQ